MDFVIVWRYSVFTGFAIFLWLFLMPFLMGSSVAFHSINEKKRYELPKIATSLPEKVLIGVCVGIILVFLYIYTIFPSLILPYPMIYGVNAVILAVFYIIKIIISLITGKPICVLISFSLISWLQKILMLLLFCLVILVTLENLHIIST